METLKTVTDITIRMLVPREDVIRTALFISIIPQAWLTQNLLHPIMWFLINLIGLQMTPIIKSSIYVLSILLFLNLMLTFILAIASTSGGSKLSYLMWYLLVFLLYLELFFTAFYASYRKVFIEVELTVLLNDKIANYKDPEARITVDLVQYFMACCGSSSPHDWDSVEGGLPESCCDMRENVNSVNILCPRYGVWYSPIGCAEKGALYYESYPILIVSALWKLALFHFILLIAVFWSRVMTKEDMMDRLKNIKLTEEFPPLPKPNELPREPCPTTYYKTVYNKDHYMELMIKGESAGRWVPHYRFDKMRNANERLIQLKKNLNIA